MVKPLNALLLGENYAANLGINLRLTRTLLLLVTGVLTAVSTAYCGPISFLGLAVPHMARLCGSADNRYCCHHALHGRDPGPALHVTLYAPATRSDSLNVITPFFGVPVFSTSHLQGKYQVFKSEQCVFRRFTLTLAGK